MAYSTAASSVQRLPLVLRLLGVPVAVLVTWSMIDERGWAMGAVAAVTFGSLAISLIIWDKTVAWAHRHPFLDSLVQLPTLFVAIALLSSLPIWLCAAIGLPLGALLVALAAYLRKRRVPRSQ